MNKQDHNARSPDAGDLLRALAMDAPQHEKVNQADIEPDIAAFMLDERGRVAVSDDLDCPRIEPLHDRG